MMGMTERNKCGGMPQWQKESRSKEKCFAEEKGMMGNQGYSRKIIVSKRTLKSCLAKCEAATKPFKEISNSLGTSAWRVFMIITINSASLHFHTGMAGPRTVVNTKYGYSAVDIDGRCIHWTLHRDVRKM
jgi:hypothetical protein